MKKESKNIDKLFKEKITDFELNQNYDGWSLTNHLLNNLQRKMKWVRILKFTLPSSLLLVAGVFWLLNDYYTNTTNKTFEKQDDIKTTYFADTTQPLIENTQESSSEINKKESTYSQKNINIKYKHDSEIKPNKQIYDKPLANISQTTFIKDSFLTDSNKNHYLESPVKTVYVHWSKNPIEIKIENIGNKVNSTFADYAPVINADASVMYFTSRRPATTKDIKKHRASPENIYYTRFLRNKWLKAKKMRTPVNQPKRFNSAIALSNDGQRMLLYRDDNTGNGDIYESELKGRHWTEPKKLPEPINSKSLETSASYSPDGRTIYFISDRPGGYGGLDIWSCTKDKTGKWGEAKNLGPLVNSNENEEGVFIHPDGKTIYFSSRGHNSYGGYDIFYSILENNQWSKPVNLGEDINTKKDDVYFVMDAAGKKAFYASQKKGGTGEKDIYVINFINEKEQKAPKLTLFKGIVLDKETEQPLTSDIEIIDIEKDELLTTLKSNAATGEFMMSLPSGKNYGINVRKEGYLFFSENMNIPAEANYKEIIKTIKLEKLKTGAKVILRNILYDYGKASLRKESINELNRLYDLLMQNPTLKVELSAHTDSRGSTDFNLKLSQARAQSCVDYLLQKGIPKKQLIAKGYGEQQLLISDAEIANMQTEKEKEEAHQQNRRTEIKILEK